MTRRYKANKLRKLKMDGYLTFTCPFYYWVQ